MNLKTNYSLKLLLITLLLFNLISSCLSIQFNRVTYHNLDVFTTNSSSLLSRLLTPEDKLLTLGDNTLVFINGTRILSDSPIKVNVLRDDGNLTSFDLKCPFGIKYILQFRMALKLNYILILYHEESYEVHHDVI